MDHRCLLIDRYQKSDKIQQLTNGKLCIGSPLSTEVFPDRRKQKQLLYEFPEIYPQSLQTVIAPFCKTSVLKSNKVHPLYAFALNILGYYDEHTVVQKGVRTILHKFGCVEYKDSPCNDHASNTPMDYRHFYQPPLMSKAKHKTHIDDKVEWNDLDYRTVNKNTLNEFHCNVPFLKLNKVFSENILSLYEDEFDRLSSIYEDQPIWTHPNWSPSFAQLISAFILENPTSREAVERWLVKKIKAKQTYKSWRNAKKKEIKKWIGKNKTEIIRNLSLILKMKTWGNIPLVPHRFTETVKSFAKSIRIKPDDIFNIDIMEFVKGINPVLLTNSMISSGSESSDMDSVEHAPLRDIFQSRAPLRYVRGYNDSESSTD